MRVSVGSLARRYRWRIGLSLVLILLEGIGYLLGPLVIGVAVDGLLDDSYSGLLALAGLAIAIITVSAIRRLYDARLYASMFEDVAGDVAARERAASSDVSVVAARAGLVEEVVAFFQESVPELTTGAVGILGTMLILAGIDTRLLVACIALLVLVVIVYAVTGRLNLRLNEGYNDELERQVAALRHDEASSRAHFARLVRWDIRLWDLDTANTTVVAAASAAFLIFSLVVIVGGEPEIGLVISGLIYVLAYIELLVTLPGYAQELIRLREIAGRLETPAGSSQGEG
jgi:ABC-type multidrug transport system fused ATPase/permease subunit